jgi:hypothetical protein
MLFSQVWPRFPEASGTMQFSDFYGAIDFRFTYDLPLLAEPRRSHWVMPKDFASISSPLRPWLQRKLGFVAARQLTHNGRLTALRFRSKRLHTYGFFRTFPRGLPISFQISVRLGAPSQCPCLISVGFPSLGLRVRTCAFRRSPPIFWPCQSHGFRLLRSLHPGLCYFALSALRTFGLA